jgi:hypothetical protein
MRDFRDAKTMAHALRLALKNRAIETTHSDSLELIAKAFGYDNWNILSAKIEAAKPSPVAGGAISSAGAADSGSPKTLYCSFCGKSQHDVRKLIAGPLVFICDACVQLCTDVVKGEDTLWKVLSLLAVENKGDDSRAAALEHLRGRPTDDLASFVERSKQVAVRNQLIVQSLRRKLVAPPGEDLQEDDVLLTLRNSAYLKYRSREELVALQQGAERSVKCADDAMRLGMRVLDERKGESRT